MITEDYVSFKTAKLLKEKGFDEECWYWYEEDGYFKDSNDDYGFQSNSDHISDDFICSSPTLQMAMKWLREREWFICVIPLAFYCGEKVSKFGYSIWAGDNFEVNEENTPEFTTYKEACEAAIKYCLENLIQI